MKHTTAWAEAVSFGIVRTHRDPLEVGCEMVVRSEVRLGGDRDVILKIRIVFGADLLGKRLLNVSIALDRRRPRSCLETQ